MLLREKEGWTRQYMRISELIQHNELLGQFWCENKHNIVCTNEAQKEPKKGWLDSIGVFVKLMKKRSVGNVFIND
jgi:hypothetical protein